MSAEHDALNEALVLKYQATMSPGEHAWHQQRRAFKGRHPASFRGSRPPVGSAVQAERSKIVLEFITANQAVFSAELSGPARQHGQHWLTCQLLLLLPDPLAGMQLAGEAKPLKMAIACVKHAVLEAAEQEAQLVAPPRKILGESWEEHKEAKGRWRHNTYQQLTPDS